jgi:hypothetical protein
VRVAVAAIGGGSISGAGALAADATGRFVFADGTDLWVVGEGCAEASLAGEVWTGWLVSASGASGNQKSRSCQSTTPRASRSRQREPSINLRCLGSSGARIFDSARSARLVLGTMVFRSDMVETGAAPGEG